MKKNANSEYCAGCYYTVQYTSLPEKNENGIKDGKNRSETAFGPYGSARCLCSPPLPCATVRPIEHRLGDEMRSRTREGVRTRLQKGLARKGDGKFTIPG